MLSYAVNSGTKMASKDSEISPPRGHSTPKQIIKKTVCQEKVDNSERRSLQTLQQSATDEKILVGKGININNSNGKADEKPKIKPSSGLLTVFHDVDLQQKSSEDKPTPCVTVGTQTDDSLLEDLIQERLIYSQRNLSLVQLGEDDAYDMMTKETVSENYWKEVAEQRRLALSDTLEENQSLHIDITSLREENEKLSELACQAAHLSSLLQSVVSDAEGDNDADEDKGKDDADNGKADEVHEVSNISEIPASQRVSTKQDNAQSDRICFAEGQDGQSGELPTTSANSANDLKTPVPCLGQLSDREDEDDLPKGEAKC